MDTGLRISEVLALRDGDIELHNLVLKVFGKGRRSGWCRSRWCCARRCSACTNSARRNRSFADHDDTTLLHLLTSDLLETQQRHRC